MDSPQGAEMTFLQQLAAGNTNLLESKTEVTVESMREVLLSKNAELDATYKRIELLEIDLESRDVEIEALSNYVEAMKMGYDVVNFYTDGED